MKKPFEEILQALGEHIVNMMKFNNDLLQENLRLMKEIDDLRHPIRMQEKNK